MIVECMLIGGPLNGKRGAIKGNAKTVELELYNADGSIASVELYALGDGHPTPTFRYHVGTVAAPEPRNVLKEGLNEKAAASYIAPSDGWVGKA